MKVFFLLIFVIPLVLLYVFKQPPASNTLLLVMVKNEGAIIARLLFSAKPRADYLYVCDTGSTDNTLYVIRKTWANADRMRIDTNHTPFVNFEENRNRCKDAAREFLKRKPEWNVEWVITADADYTLVDRHPQKTPEYAINMIQIHGTPHNSLNMLFEKQVFFESCQYKLWTHEFIDCGKESVSQHFDGFYFEDHADGKNREEKTRRDILLLTQWLHEQNTSDVRSRALYYLARAYEDAELYDAAVQCYEKHNLESNFTNYQFYALYRMAIIQLKTKTQKVETAFLKALKAYDGDFRKEPYYYLARYFREQGEINKCIMYGTAGLYAPQVNHARMPLFLETVIYDWALEEELAYCKKVKGYKAEANAHFNNLLQKPLDDVTRERIKNYFD
jgi:glycosyltransferase involved in cell wall biosynthesis